MSGKVPLKAISKAVVAGIETAQHEYEVISGGEWLYSTSEYVITTYVAKEIAGLPGTKAVTIETSGRMSLEDAGARPRGPKPMKARLPGRFDLLVWWASGLPRGVIELKNQLTGPSVWYADIERIEAVLRMDAERSSLQFGMFGYYFSSIDGSRLSARERVERKLEGVADFVYEGVGNKLRVRPVNSDIHEDGDSAWAAACLVFTRKT